MKPPIGSPQGLSRRTGLAIAWGLTFVCLSLGAYEWVYPGSLSPSGRTASLFSFARDILGQRGVSVAYFAIAIPTFLIALSIQLSLKGRRNEG